VYPHAFTAHVRRAPFACARFFRDCPARGLRILDCVGRKGDTCDARIQRSEQERLGHRRLARMYIQLGRRGALSDLNEPGGCERGEEVIAQDADIAYRRCGDVVLIHRRAVRKFSIRLGERANRRTRMGRTSEQKARMALCESSWRIRMHSSYACVSVRVSLFSTAKRARALCDVLV
jgi:hypothetical protein